MALACSKPSMALHCVLCYFQKVFSIKQEQCSGGVSGIPKLIGEQGRQQEESLFALAPAMTIQGSPWEGGRGSWPLGLRQGHSFVLTPQWQDVQHRSSLSGFLGAEQGGESWDIHPALPRQVHALGALSIQWKAGGGGSMRSLGGGTGRCL